ncbi:MAG TPA: FtsX-like permease family protein [Rectinemataceae bacterium]|nr:FtsX-like permease family protein [Rectinemataceae bacterium]
MTRVLASIAFRNVLRHGKRTLITSLVLTVGIGMFIFFDSILAGMDRMTIDSMVDYTESSMRVMTSEYQKNNRGLPLDYGIASPESLIGRIAELVPDAIASTPRTAFVAYASNRIDSVPVIGTAIDPVRDKGVFKLSGHLGAGAWLVPYSADNEILIGKGLAKDLGLGVGDWLVLSARAVDDTLNADEFRIAGILDLPAQEISQSGVFIGYGAARALLGEDLPVTTIAVALPKTATLDKELAASVKAATAIRGALPGMEAVPIADASKDYMAMRNMKAKYSSLIILVVLLIAGVGIVNTILMSVYSRIKEIGVLRAYGMLPGQIRRLFSLEGTMIGFIGSLGGILLGSLLVWWSVKWGIPLDKMFSGLDLGSIPMGGALRGEWHPATMAAGFIFGVAASWLSARIPAKKAGKLEVTDALHFV